MYGTNIKVGIKICHMLKRKFIGSDSMKNYLNINNIYRICSKHEMCSFDC